MEIEIRDTVIPRWDIRQEGKVPCEPSAKDDVVHVRNRGAVCEEHRPAIGRDVRYFRLALDVRMLEGFVSKVDVVFSTDNRVDRSIHNIDYTDSCVGS